MSYYSRILAFSRSGTALFFAGKLLYGDDFCDYDSVLVKGQLHLPLLIGNAHGLKPAGRERDLMRFAPAPAVPPAVLLLIRANRLSMLSPLCALKYIIFGTNSQYFFL